MPDCILHVGMHKTGSSSIQATLQATLTEDGAQIALLKLPSANISGALRIAFDDMDSFVRARSGGADERKVRAHLESRRAPLRARIAEFLEENRNRQVVISAEGFDNLSETSLREFLALVPHSRVRAICYVRSPQGNMSSALQQRVKSGRVRLRFPALLQKYRRMLEKYQKVDIAFEPCLFDRATLLNGCVVQDFHARAGLPLDPAQVVTSNESISRDAVGLLWCMNRWREEQGRAPLRTTRLTDWLRTVPGKPLTLSRSVYEKTIKANAAAADIAWAEALLNTRFDARDTPDGAIERLDDLGILSDAALDWLETQAPGTESPGARMSALAGDRLRILRDRKKAGVPATELETAA